MGLSLNKVVKPQSEALNSRATVFSTNTSPTKRPYVEGAKRNLNKSDVKYMLKNIKRIYKLPFTLGKTVKLIKKDQYISRRQMTRETFDAFGQLLASLGVDQYGFFKVESEDLFKGYGVPHKYALVFSSGMSTQVFETAPSIECQLEVARVYCQTGDIANKVAEFLQQKGYGASPNHSMGGQLDYSMAAERAGIAVTGRHSMAITKENGPCNRISVVYTNIENLSDFIMQNNNDMLWIKDFCQKCGKCQRKCPTGAILIEPVTLDGYNPTRIVYEKCAEGFANYGCGICIKECPFTKGNYETIKAAYLKKEVTP